MRLLTTLYAVCGLFLTIVYAAFVSIPIVPFAVVPRGRRERYTKYGMQLFAWLNLRPLLFVRDQVIGKENLPPERGFLIVSNHRSWTDVPLHMLHTASQGISKKEVAYVPFFGVNGYLTGAIFFDRKSPGGRAKVLTESIDMMKKGANLHLFPEGTRTRDGKIKTKVHLRLLELAWENGIECVPTAVWDTEKVLPTGEFRAVPFQRCGLEIGKPLRHADFQTGAEYAKATWARVVEMAQAHGADEPFAGR